ncbi:hypothetical protein CY34DRAFT_803754 [Suillus luteus UH-Slu-Lm8-n1]|uniref:Uncharacterized protein n=1 Tax=Suillus luteus UH-Slu-Lm8-n1 TaxID=930992 RepID=A0A0D0AP12_9AGAM|nr:hypothetical protein CY34DRAFT_803754 [Suillus luteus UH-Slu-Lm8-n1]
MVFSLFTRKPGSPPVQLHTPSPSGSPAALSSTPPPTTQTEPDSEVTDPTALYDLVCSVPPQTLHAYTLAHLSPTSDPPLIPLSPRTLTALTYFFHQLSPPPQLHCVRCHSSFFDLSNTDTSCRIPHDDESALVDRSAYETLWGCCGASVEGTGDMGPPDGWCYEGRHTTDTKRARFRADSTIYDDKLSSCAATGCHGRKRKRSISVSSGDLSASIRKKDKAKVNVDSSPKSVRKPTSKSSTPKPLSKSGTFISSITLPQPRIKPLPKSNLHQSHIALSTVDAVSESESDTQQESDIPSRPTRERTRTRSTVDEQKTRLTADDKTRPLADENMCRPRTRSAAREERSLSRTRALVRGGSIRVLREREREKEKGITESDGDERRGRGREVKKRRVGV